MTSLPIISIYPDIRVSRYSNKIKHSKITDFVSLQTKRSIEDSGWKEVRGGEAASSCAWNSKCPS